MNSPQDDLDTSSARKEILSRIRSLQSRPESARETEKRLADEYVHSHAIGPQPSPVADVVSLFIEKTKAMLSTVDVVGSEGEVVDAVKSYLSERGLSGKVSIWPTLDHLDWQALGLDVKFGAPAGDDLIGVSGVAYAVAETGTLVFASQPDQPASTHLLPETHIAVVHAAQVVHTMERVFELRRQAGLAMPRAMNFVSGPSRTADIEQTIVLGAHGPYRVHVVLVQAS